MFSWGSGKFGQTCLNHTNNQNTPSPSPSEINNIQMIACSPRYNILLTSDSDLYSWGHGFLGEMGLAYVKDQPMPSMIKKIPTNLKFKHVATGSEHSLAVSVDGDLYVWGCNDLGQLGTGNLKPLDRPTKLNNLNVKFQMVAAGTKHSLALSEYGTCYSWGAGWAGQQGDKDNKDYLSPRLISENLNFKLIGASEYSSFAVTSMF